MFAGYNRYHDPFWLNVLYFLAGKPDVAGRIGEFMQAKERRSRVLDPLNAARVRLENVQALAGYLSQGRGGTGAPARDAAERVAAGELA